MNILNKKSGYTLMEIMVVVIIIGTLAAAAIPYYKDHIERQKAATGITTLRMFADSIERYMSLHGETLPEGFDFTKLDLDIDHSRLSQNNKSYTDENFTFQIDVDGNTVKACRGSSCADDSRRLYTLSYSLGDESSLSCSSTTDNYCSETLHITCGS